MKPGIFQSHFFTAPYNGSTLNDYFYSDLINYLKNNILNFEYYDSPELALIGDNAAMDQDQIYSQMGELDEGYAVVIDPSLIGAVDVPDLPSDVLGVDLPVEDYADVIIGAFDGEDVVEVPSVGEIDIPDVIPVPGVTVGEEDDNPAHVIDLPGTIPGTGENTGTGEGTDVIDDPLVIDDVAGITDPVEDILNWGLGYISPATGILSKFPFSIPYDLYMIVNALSGETAVDAINADPKELTINNDLAPPGTTYEAASTSALSWHFTFTIPFENTQTVIPLDIDLSDYEWVFRIIRYFTGILWLVGLLSWTRKESS